MKKSTVYTRGGDKGSTSLVGGTRVAKDSPRLEAYGTIDELNSWLGLLASHDMDQEDKELLAFIQNRLFDIGSMLATEPDSRWQPEPLGTALAETLEQAIDRIDSTLPAHRQFILPGGSIGASHAHIARCIARRAERRIVTLSSATTVDPDILRFVNRLSDYLFVLARALNTKNGSKEIFWEKKR